MSIQLTTTSYDYGEAKVTAAEDLTEEELACRIQAAIARGDECHSTRQHGTTVIAYWWRADESSTYEETYITPDFDTVDRLQSMLIS